MVFVSISMYKCYAGVCVSAVFGNQLEFSLLLIFQPIVMKHCCEGLSNNLLSAQACLSLFSWIPLLELAERLHCVWAWGIKRRNKKLSIKESVLQVRSVSQEKYMTPCLNICQSMCPFAWKWTLKLFQQTFVWHSEVVVLNRHLFMLNIVFIHAWTHVTVEHMSTFLQSNWKINIHIWTQSQRNTHSECRICSSFIFFSWIFVFKDHNLASVFTTSWRVREKWGK